MLAPNTLLQNRYLVLKLLGRGGMGAVYLARDTRFSSNVAIKEMILDDNQDVREAFAREAQLLNSMRHAALAHVTDYFFEGSGQFLVMQFIDGTNLADALEKRLDSKAGPFPWEQVVQWGDQLLDALSYLHHSEPSVIHQDIKPQNIILTLQGTVMLLDFGLARIKELDSSDYLSLPGFTPPYASIEQITVGRVDPRSDLFSLGATLYHLMVGYVPPKSMERMYEVMSNNSDPLRLANVLNPKIPPQVAEVINQSLALQPTGRYSSAIEMREALRKACL